MKQSLIQASAEKVFGFHESPDALERLQPPWQESKVVQPPTSLEVGTRVVLKVKIGPFWQKMVAEHVAYEPGRMFADELIQGPFKKWHHRHIVTPRGENECVLTDDIEYELPLGAVGQMFGGWLARRNLEKLFEFRHRVTREACEDS